jgi:hypothetical protein
MPTVPVAIYSLKDLRDEAAGVALGQAMTSGALLKVRRIRRDAHEPEASCVVHGATGCLSI